MKCEITFLDFQIWHINRIALRMVYQNNNQRAVSLYFITAFRGILNHSFDEE